MNIVGHRIKERRIAVDKTRREFIIDIANVSRQRWSPSEADLANIETRKRTVTDIELVILANAIGLTVEQLLNGQG